jgi:hypothetical protein
MSNLLAIETAFLALPQVKQALNLAEINRVQRGITNAQKQKFSSTMNLSKLAVSVVEWFESPEGQAITSEEGISWNNEEIGAKVFGWQKSYFYKVLKAGKLPEEVVSEFTAKCDEADRAGLNPDRSLAGLLKWTRAGGDETEAGGEGVDSEGGDATEGTAVEIRPETIFTLSYKPTIGKNVAVRVNSQGEVKTTNSREEIRQAINFLLNISMQVENEQEAENDAYNEYSEEYLRNQNMSN